MNALRPWAVALALAVGSPAVAQTPTKAVLLDDLSLLEGTVERFDGVVRVTPAVGPAKLVTAAQVTHVAASREAAYDFVAGKVDTSTADGAKKLAAWCEKVGLTERALAHAKAAAALAPTDATLRETVARLQKAAAAKPTPVPAKPKPAAAEPGPAKVPDLPADAGIGFAAKAQPILLNRCGTCHGAKSHAGTFKLGRITEGYASPEATAANLKATAAQLSRDTPAASPLLAYALTAHGGQKTPAFATRQQPAFQHLETWVLSVLPAVPANKGFASPTPVPPADADAPLPGAVVGTLGQPVPAKPTPPAPTTPPPAVKPRDPFDPNRFNQLPKKP